MNTLSYFALQPISELSIWGWRLERRTEFLWRDQFDRFLLPPLFAAAQAMLNATRQNEGLALAEERELPEEERWTQEIIDQLAAFMKENWLPGSVQRFGNTKTFGVLRGEFRVLPDLPDHLRHGVLASERTYPAWVRFSGPGPYAPPDLYDYGQCSVAIKLMDVPGPKLLDDERFTQDLIMVSPASFVTPNVRENAKLQRYVRARTNLFYFMNPADTHLLAAFMQALYSRMHTSPLETRYYSNVPFLLGDGQAVQYSLRPRSKTRTRIPVRASDNYLREAMARTLADGSWSFDFMVQGQTDPHRMPIEDATVKWPERLSPYVPVAELRLAAPAVRRAGAAGVRRQPVVQPVAQPRGAPTARQPEPGAPPDVPGALPATTVNEPGPAHRANRRLSGSPGQGLRMATARDAAGLGKLPSSRAG